VHLHGFTSAHGLRSHHARCHRCCILAVTQITILRPIATLPPAMHCRFGIRRSTALQARQSLWRIAWRAC